MRQREGSTDARDRRRGTALLGTLVLSLAVAVMAATYLLISQAEVKKARIPSARSRALYDVLGKLARARLLINRSRYDSAGHNLVLYHSVDGTLPGAEVDIVSSAGTPDDPAGIYYTLVASATHEGVTVTARQLVAERESFASYMTLVADADLGISGIEDEDYDPDDPAPVPPAALSQGKIHTNKQMELYFSGWRHFVNPVTGGVPDGDWAYEVGAEPEKQIFWFDEESRPDAAQVTFPELAAFAEVKNLVTDGATPVNFPGSWADDLVTVNATGYHVSGEVNVLVEFEGTSGTFSLTLREQGGSHRTAKVSRLALPPSAGVLFVENGYDPDAPGTAPNQTVHLKGDIKGRLTVFAPTGDARIAGSIRYVDADGNPAALADRDGIYARNEAYRGNSTLGIIAEYDVRLGIKPERPVWSATQYHIDAVTGQWVYTGSPGLKNSPIAPKGEYDPVEEELFGYMGGPPGRWDAEVHAAIFARRGRLYADGMNPMGYEDDSWAYRLGYRQNGWVTTYSRWDAALYRYGSMVCSRRPVTNLVDSEGTTLLGWGKGQAVYDEDLAVNAPPYYFRQSRPTFYEPQISGVDLGSVP